MSRKLFFLLGLLTGAVLIELFYRPLKARLKASDTAEAERQKFNDFLERDQAAFLDTLSPADKMRYTVAMAEWGDEDEDEE